LISKKKEIEQKYSKLARENKDFVDIKSYRYILMKGNNDPIIKKVMDARPSW